MPGRWRISRAIFNGMLHKEILTAEQLALLPFIRQFAKEYYLVGGTAIALYLGHRRSLDFDLFTLRPLKRKRIRRMLEASHFPLSDVIYEAADQFHILVNGVKMTFFQYPYEIEHLTDFEQIISLPVLLDLAAMKAYALGGRAKWKDYVDLYFLLKDHFRFQEIAQRAKDLFGNFFNAKLFREQLGYFKDIDYREAVEYMGNMVEEQTIQDFLGNAALTPF